MLARLALCLRVPKLVLLAHELFDPLSDLLVGCHIHLP
jgi:hypothetical protein